MQTVIIVIHLMVVLAMTGVVLLQRSEGGGLGMGGGSGGFLTSQVTFNAQVGVDYQIAVDGLNGACGDILLSWVTEITTDRVPVIASMSGGQTVGMGEDVTFAVSVDTSPVAFQWYLNGGLIPDAQSN